MKKIKTAIIGCGAITEKTHLPLLSKSGKFNVCALVDAHEERASQLAGKFNIPVSTTDYREVIHKIDAAVLALPPHINASVSIGLLRKGVHVLVEKPMAMKVSECDAMIQCAEESDALLMVGLIRRYYPNFIFIKKMLDSGIIGDLNEVDIQEGSIFKWNIKTGYSFRKDTGGGLLPAIGVHVFDSLLWWIGDYETVEYYDDTRGGVEADCRVILHYQNNTKVKIELSRLRNLRNTYIFKGTDGRIETGSRYNSPIYVHLNGANKSYSIDNYGNDPADPDNLFLSQYDDFAQSILNNTQSPISGDEGKRSVALIEDCYNKRQPYVYPWLI